MAASRGIDAARGVWIVVAASLVASAVLLACDGDDDAPRSAEPQLDGAASEAGAFDAGPRAARDAGSDAGARNTPGIAPHPRLAALADETALDLDAFECSAPAGEDEDLCRRVTDYSGLVYDGHHHQMLMFGGGHSTTMTDSVFAFDLDDTLRWGELYRPTPCDLMVESNLDAKLGAWKMGPAGPYPRPLSIHTYDLLAFSPAQDEFLLLGRLFTGGHCNSVGNDIGGNVAHFSLGDEVWSFSSTAAGASSVAIPASELDPVSGRIVVFGSDGLKLYDPKTRAYTASIDNLKDGQGGDFDVSGLGYANHLVYFEPTDTFYYFKRGSPVEVVALRLDRAQPTDSRVAAVATTGKTSPHQEPGYAYDSGNRIIGGGIAANTFYAFDPTTATWSAHAIRGGAPGDQAFHALGYDPANNVFIFRAEYGSGQHTWAYRFRRQP